MIDPQYIVRLAESNEIHTEGGIVQNADRIAGHDVELRENWFAGDDFYIISCGGHEHPGQMASYEVPAEDVKSVERVEGCDE
jgi:hypothetical protein